LVEKGGNRYIVTACHVATAAAAADGNFRVAKACATTREFRFKPKRFLEMSCIDYVAYHAPDNLGSVLGIRAAPVALPVEGSPIRVLSYGDVGYSASLAVVARPHESELPPHKGAEIFRLKYGASTTFGSSGSGLFDAAGRCVGVHNGTMGAPHGTTVNIGTMLVLTDFRKERGFEAQITSSPQKGVMYSAVALAAQEQFQEQYGAWVQLMGMSEESEDDWYTVTAYLEDELIELAYHSSQHVLASGYKVRESAKRRKHGRNTDRSGASALRNEAATSSETVEGPLNSAAPAKAPLELAEERATQSAFYAQTSCSKASAPEIHISMRSKDSSTSGESVLCGLTPARAKPGGSQPPLSFCPSSRDMACQTEPPVPSLGPSDSRQGADGAPPRPRRRNRKKRSDTSSSAILPAIKELS
jgi:hypothetical protein